MAEILNGIGRQLSFYFSACWIIIVIFCGLFANFLPLPDYASMDWENQRVRPGTRIIKFIPQDNGEQIQEETIHLLGSDTLGRDIFSRLVFGTRISLTIGFLVPIVGLLLGGFLGVIAGFYQGKLETVIMASMDIILAFPGIVLMLAITFYLGPGLNNLVIALGLLVMPAFCRVARANTLKFSQCEFIEAAKMLGHNNAKIIGFEILPNILTPMIAYALIIVAYMIIAEGVLSFLGLSVPPPTPSWGGMIAEGKAVLEEAPFIALFPSLIMFLTVLSFNLMGDHLRNLINTKESQL